MGTRGQADVAAAFPQLEQAAALEVALAFADPGLLLAQLAHEQVQLPLHDVHLALGQLLLPPPQLLLLEALLLRRAQQLLLPAAELLERGREACEAGLNSFAPGRAPGLLGRAGARNRGVLLWGKLGARSNSHFTSQAGCQGRGPCWPRERVPFFSFFDF